LFFSVAGSLAAMFIFDSNAKRDPDGIGLIFIMVAQHFLISTTMLVVGLFAVLSWDSTFPDQRDALVLTPLPVRARTMFLAKVTAVTASLGLTIVLLHSGLGLILPLLFASRATPVALPAVSFDATTVPVAARDLQTMMDRDLKQALTSGDLAPGTGAGLAIGVWKNGERRVFTYGAAKPDSLFEIGSVSKTFTGLMLAQMVAQSEVRLDEPVRELLPAGTVQKPAGTPDKDSEITLLDLAMHRSGLPPMPDNFGPAGDVDRWADYGPQELYAYMAKRGVAKPADAASLYSNLGVGLLGQVLADRAGKSYADHLRDEITGPLGMPDTVLRLSREQQERFLQGHDDKHRPLPEFHRDGALAGAGAILSTAGDMMTFLEANLHPEKTGSLSNALASSHRLSWAYIADTGTYWHNGSTSGFTSNAFFNPRMDSAVVVLMNIGPNLLFSSGPIAEHI